MLMSFLVIGRPLRQPPPRPPNGWNPALPYTAGRGPLPKNCRNRLIWPENPARFGIS